MHMCLGVTMRNLELPLESTRLAAAEGAQTPAGSRRLWLVRHGLTAWNASGRFCGHADPSLISAGRAQARWLGRVLRQQSIAAIYTSDLARAQETAALIAVAQPYTVPVLASAVWRELAFGMWEGLTYAQIASSYPDQLVFFSEPERQRPPEGETLDEVWSRVQTGLAEMRARCAGQAGGDIVLVSHGGTLRLLLCHLLALPVTEQWQLHMEPGSLSAIDLPLDEASVPTQGVLTLFNMSRPERRRAGAEAASLASEIERKRARHG